MKPTPARVTSARAYDRVVGSSAEPRRTIARDEMRALGRICPDGRIHEFALPDRTARPHAIVADRHDCCWLSQWANSRVARVTADGHVCEIILPAASEPHGLTIGPDGALWVALEAGSAARIDI